MALSKDDKDEIRLIIHEEIVKAFKAGLNAAINVPINLGEAVAASIKHKDEERQKRNKLIKDIGRNIKSALQDLETEAQARIVEKTDPARAEKIRKIKTSF